MYLQQKGKVFQIDLLEMKAFIGITSFMGYHLWVPCLREYCSQDPGRGINVVANVMPRDRFFEIRTALHFVDNEQPHDTKDIAWKIRCIIKRFNKFFSRAMSPTALQAIDEHMVKFKGQHAMKQYMSISNEDSICGVAMTLLLDIFFSLICMAVNRKAMWEVRVKML